MTPADNLRKAATLLRERGWCQGDYEDAEGRCCLIGAVRHVLAIGYIGLEERLTERPIRATLEAEGGGWMSGPLSWNDQPGRTVDEVIALLERAAEMAEAQEIERMGALIK